MQHAPYWPAMAHDHGERWDESDITELKSRLIRGDTYQEIADHMGRTRAAVASKIKRLRRSGMSLDQGQPETQPEPEKPAKRSRFGRRRQ